MNRFLSALRTLSLLEWLAWIGGISFLCFHLGFLTHPTTLSGWDTGYHYYLASLMLEFLREGRLSGWDPNAYAGYPAFVLYPPLSYLILLTPYLVSFGLLTLQVSLKLTYALIPFVLLSGAFWSAGIILGKRYRAPALLFMLLFLASPQEWASSGFGLSALVAIGLLPNFVALCMWVPLMAIGERLRREDRSGFLIGAGAVLFAALALTHTLTWIFSLWCLVLSLFFATGKKRWSHVWLLSAGLLLSSSWLFPFVSYSHLGSSVARGLPFYQQDPLLALFPGVGPGVLKLFTEQRDPWLFSLPWMGGQQLLIQVPRALLEFPLGGLIMLVSTIAGLTVLTRQKELFLPVLFISSLIVLPRNFLASSDIIPLYFFRFTQHIAILNVFIMAAGLVALGDWLQRRAWLPRALYSTLGVLTLSGVVAFSCFVQYSISSPRPWKSEGKALACLEQEKCPDYQDALAVVHFLEQLSPTGRIATENSLSQTATIGTPHFFSMYLSSLSKLKPVMGLLIESSLSSPFINMALLKDSATLAFGRTLQTWDDEFAEQSLASMIERMKVYQTEYIVSVSEDYYNALKALDSENVERVTRIGKYGIFRIHTPRSFVEPALTKPFLFVERGGMGFREFCFEWFRRPELLSIPVIFDPGSHDSLENVALEDLSGIVVSWPARVALGEGVVQEWTKFKKPIVFLNANAPAFARPDEVAMVPQFGRNVGGEELAGVLRALAVPSSGHEASARASRAERQSVEFDYHGGVIINYSYFPRWQVTKGASAVYWVTPSLLFTFARGETRLEFK